MQPPGLHSLILYDNFEWKTAHKSYENFRNICDLTKIPTIALEEFETNFYGILKENYQQKLDFRNIAKIDSLKLCILSDVLAGKSIEKSHEDLSETFEAENIDFSVVDFWYYRVYNGSYDLDYDRKNYSKPLEFSDLPIIIHHEIIDILDLKNQLTLRKVSKSLKNIVDQGKPAIKRMKIDIKLDFIYMKIDDLSAYYSEDLDSNYREIALNYVMTILRNPKLQLDCLHIVSSSTDLIFIDFLKNLQHKISTKFLDLDMDGPETTHLLLACMKPKFLEVVTLKTGNIDEIVKLDQWKWLNKAFVHRIFRGSLDCFLGFSVFSIKLWELTEEHLMKLKEVKIHFFVEFRTQFLFFQGLTKSPNFECCYIYPRQYIRRDLIEKVFSYDLQHLVKDSGYPNQIGYSYTIPNVFKIIISRGHLMIMRHRS
ncbi:hypothetical protein B9Z55_021109 [Caenorhabditis nigoni]|uniref:F-box domain-containing protein n=1 Tax=Caenorhabditis nigoni TaxID=1611254 RepID=A0A2G5TQQ4_9PELO|nr:hypothetical protein B9Z55_021109 [Caenorhabditis nigoni]